MSLEKKTLYYLVSELSTFDGTGIHRVTKAIYSNLETKLDKSWNLVAIYGTEDGDLYYSKLYQSFLHEELIDFNNKIKPKAEDVFLSVDLVYNMSDKLKKRFKGLREKGVSFFYILYDLIPIRHREWFSGESIHSEREYYLELFENWVDFVCTESDGLICISNTVKVDVNNYLNEKYKDMRWPKLSYFHLGYDIKANRPTVGFPQNANQIISSIKKSISFLIVGTLEPRKSHKLVLSIFELFWKNDIDVTLTIAGRAGKPWMSKYTEELIDSIENHTEINKRLFFLESPSDEYLEKVYENSSVLLMLSEDEGFGLPLIEASQYGLPIIARDINIFRELCRENAFFVKAVKIEEYFYIINEWLELFKINKYPKSTNIPKLTWADSTTQLLEKLNDMNKSIL